MTDHNLQSNSNISERMFIDQLSGIWTFTIYLSFDCLMKLIPSRKTGFSAPRHTRFSCFSDDLTRYLFHVTLSSEMPKKWNKCYPLKSRHRSSGSSLCTSFTLETKASVIPAPTNSVPAHNWAPFCTWSIELLMQITCPSPFEGVRRF